MGVAPYSAAAPTLGYVFGRVYGKSTIFLETGTYFVPKASSGGESQNLKFGGFPIFLGIQP
jgi:hypothetical protein